MGAQSAGGASRTQLQGGQTRACEGHSEPGEQFQGWETLGGCYRSQRPLSQRAATSVSGLGVTKGLVALGLGEGG